VLQIQYNCDKEFKQIYVKHITSDESFSLRSNNLL